MAWHYTTNVLLPGRCDKASMLWITLKDLLVATGRWRVRGSGDGKSAFQLMGQTAGLAGSFDVFTASPPYAPTGGALGVSNTLSNNYAWLLLEEIASGRLVAVRRETNSGYTSYCAVYAALGAATSGANATTLPALTTSSLLLQSYMVSVPAEWDITAAHEAWLQIAIDDSVRPGNVSPWWYCTWSKTTNQKLGAGFWWPMEDLEPAITNNVITTIGHWSNTFGIVGDGNSGAVRINSTWRGGNAWDVCNLCMFTNWGVNTSPPSYQALDSTGKYRTERPWIVQQNNGRRIGRLPEVYLNKVAREYPTTYDIAGATPRLTLGHFIVPWTNVAPNTSP